MFYLEVSGIENERAVVMMLKKKIIFLITILFCAVLFSACGKKEEEQNDFVIDEILGDKITGAENTDEIHERWEYAYKEIICNMDRYLSDPYIERSSSESDVDSVIGYVGIHDFNHDNIPELIIGDLVSVGVFTFEDGVAKKIADLYEPEDWCYISGVYYKDNTIVLVNSGSDGSCYVCFTYDDGEGLGRGGIYVTGIYDEYNHMGAAVINGGVVAEETFKERFHLTGLLDNSMISRSRIKKENGIATALVINAFEKDYDYIRVEDFDFNAVEW